MSDEPTQTTEWPEDLLGRMTVACRSAFAAGLPTIAGTIEDAATKIILLQGRIAKLERPNGKG